ncbi:four helix bundle protein [Variovorax sp. LT1R16]|uniref:four helix bundle protein n=1 Tax=Variovorax sp. LT1R16 TaxID=3443728 RepID=UPI003F473755
MALYSDLPIYKHGCDLLSLSVDVQTQMPRMFKRSLGEKIHDLCVEMLEAMAMANATRGEARVEQIEKLLKYLRAATAMLRISHDKRLISPKLWAQSVELLDAVGSQAGGWRKHTLGTLSAAPAA